MTAAPALAVEGFNFVSVPHTQYSNSIKFYFPIFMLKSL